MNTNTDTEIKKDTSHYDKCRTMMIKHKKNHILRVKLTAFFIIVNALFHVIKVPVLKGLPYLYGFFFGIGILIYCVIMLLIGWFATPERPKLLAVTCVLILIGIIGEWLAPYIG
ncbi:MAG: hypothetical protein K2O42_01910, partial [Oscillospiraceae bacterium]|nr:hypothetical protein [Oscillospiraceae bacterium]